MKAEIQPNEANIKEKKPEVKMSGRKKWLFFVVSFLLFFIIIGYGLLVYAAQSYTLPFIKYQSTDVGLKSFSEVTKIVLQTDKKIRDQKVQIELDDKTEEKTLDELGVSIQSSKTVDNIFNFGKKDIFYSFPIPTFGYIRDIISSNTIADLSVKYSSDTENKLTQLFPDSKKDANNPTLLIDDDGKLSVTAEKNGTKVDINDFTKKIESKLNGNLAGKIQLQRIQTKSNFTSSDVEMFRSDIENFIGKQLYLQTDYRTLRIYSDDLLSFVDLERTILNQKFTISDQAISDYLENTVSRYFNIAGKKREISTVDNSIISEGQEGEQIDIAESKQNIKTALENDSRVAVLVVNSSPIEDDYISPGYNLGKYPGKYIEVNLSEQMLYTIDGNSLVNSYKVSTGKWSMPTPIGDYSINNKDPRAYSSEYGLYMPYWMAFIGSQYGIHELPEWPDGTKEGENHLGIPVSHGCIRLGRGAAEEVYNWTEVGTPIFIHE